jgi:predicted NBD/HSP70 family sugar kinase
MKNKKIIGVDLGGTKVMAARIHENKIEQKAKTLITAQGSQDTVIDEIVSTITRILDSEVARNRHRCTKRGRCQQRHRIRRPEYTFLERSPS